MNHQTSYGSWKFHTVSNKPAKGYVPVTKTGLAILILGLLYIIIK